MFGPRAGHGQGTQGSWGSAAHVEPGFAPGLGWARKGTLCFPHLPPAGGFGAVGSGKARGRLGQTELAAVHVSPGLMSWEERGLLGS